MFNDLYATRTCREFLKQRGYDLGDIVKSCRKKNPTEGAGEITTLVFALRNMDRPFVTCCIENTFDNEGEGSIKITLVDETIELDAGKHDAISAIERARLYAHSTDIQIGEVLNIWRSRNLWYVKFEKENLAAINDVFRSDYFLLFSMDDDSGDVVWCKT